MLLPVVSQILRGAQEVEHAALELAERYEEINLLYTIGEILGRTVTLEEAAATILTEISETVGARHASILVHEPTKDVLQVVAAIGSEGKNAPPIAVDDPECVSSRVFRTQHPLIVAAGVMECDRERPYRKGEMLSVPIMWTTPTGGEPLGVVNLSDRRSKQPYSAGDQKLVAAIATQIGTAIQNARLVRASIEQQRLMQEMYLAHDLQMKLLPNASVVAPEATVAARVVPAMSVGGDFYHLFRMPRNRTGVMIGDVSGHGYRADHGACDERICNSCAELERSRRDAFDAPWHTARGAFDNRDVHLGVLRCDRSQCRQAALLQYRTSACFHPQRRWEDRTPERGKSAARIE
jgi:sigma-B regulation protein RsbU (phosphoserine phosphatase)